MQGKRARYRGFSLIEAAVVLGVIGLVIGGIWVAAAAVEENRKVSDMLAAVTSVASRLRNLYPDRNFAEGSANFKNITTGAVAAGVFPDNYIDNGTPKNPWGGTMYVLGYNLSSQGLSFHINAGDMPKSACIRLVSRMLGVSNASELRGVTFAPAGAEISFSSLTTTNISSTYCKTTNQQLGFRFY